MENTSEVQGPQSPCIPWPRPGGEAIQLVTWSQYLRLWATELDKQAGGGEPGLFLANYLTTLALQAEALGAKLDFCPFSEPDCPEKPGKTRQSRLFEHP